MYGACFASSLPGHEPHWRQAAPLSDLRPLSRHWQDCQSRKGELLPLRQSHYVLSCTRGTMAYTEDMCICSA